MRLTCANFRVFFAAPMVFVEFVESLMPWWLFFFKQGGSTFDGPGNLHTHTHVTCEVAILKLLQLSTPGYNVLLHVISPSILQTGPRVVTYPMQKNKYKKK